MRCVEMIVLCVLSGTAGVVPARAADPVLIPPAPQVGPGTPNFMNPVPGRSGAPVIPSNPVVPAPPPHVGGGPTVCPPVITCPPAYIVVWSPHEYVWSLGTWRVSGPTGYRVGLPYEPLEVTSRRLDPGALPPPSGGVPERPPTPQEQATALLRSGQWDQAVSALSVLVSHARNRASGGHAVPPGSTPTGATVSTPLAPPAPAAGPAPAETPWSVSETQRRLALALLGQKRAPQAARVIAEAYAADPTLCERPLSAADLGSPEALRRLMLRAVSHAQRTGGEEAWFAAAILMQAQGRAQLPPNVAAHIKTHPLGIRLVNGPAPGTP